MYTPTFRPIGQQLTALLIGSIAFTPLALGQVVDEDMKFLPTVYAAGDQFGRSIAIDNGVIAVGAWVDGAAYLFDETTGNLLFKLLPTSGSSNNAFGISVAIDNGIAIVGAFDDNVFGVNSGSAYLFDADPLSPNFGNQLVQLSTPGAADDWFGIAVAIDNGIAVVGATGYDGNATNSGAVFVFDADPFSPDFGLALLDLYPSGVNTTDHEFGSSVSINNGIIAVGASGDDTHGPFTGAAYTFDVFGNLFNKFFPTGGSTRGFGSSISVDRNGNVAVGEGLNDSAYLFDMLGTELIRFLPATGMSGDQFGLTISIDNGIVAIGAQYNDDNAIDAGAAYLFNADPASASFGTQLSQILPNNGAANEWFGSSIAIDNGIVAVGAYRDDELGFNSGSAFVFDIIGIELFQLLPTSSFDEFGWAIATDNGVVAVGAMQDSTNGPDAGAVYLYDECTGNLLIKLFPTGAVADDWFGCSVSMANGYLVVGAWGDDTNGFNAGAAYVFDADPNSPDFGIELAKLLPAVGMPTDYFGVSVAIDDENNHGAVGIIAVGAWGDDTNGNNAGAAYIFDVFGNQHAKFFPAGSLPNDHFGNVIDIDNSIVAIGAWGNDTNGTDSGTAYVFDTSGIELSQLLPSAGGPAHYFGSSIAIDDGVIAVGEYFSSATGLPFSGAAYLFETFGVELAILVPTGGAAFDNFGVSISIDNGMVVVGANRADDNGPDSGAAYMFHADPLLLPNFGTQFAKLLPTDGQSNDDFGRSVSISGQSIAVGAIWDDDTGTDNGSAYAFIPCLADFTGDGVYDFFDISAFLTEFSMGNARADLTCDGSLDFFDISTFLTAFAAGCP